jgi:hypothetical protein
MTFVQVATTSNQRDMAGSSSHWAPAEAYASAVERESGIVKLAAGDRFNPAGSITVFVTHR